LVVGKSSLKDVLRKMGKPDYLGAAAEAIDPTEQVAEFPITRPVTGRARFYCRGRKAVLIGIVIEPENLSKTEALKLFGNDFLITRYGVDDCLSKGGSAPLYEDPHGEILRLEYRRRGFALDLKGADVRAIIYTDGPFGPKESRCVNGKRKNRTPRGGG